MIDLNGKDFAEKKILIFNDGVAGKVENTTISVEKKKSGDAESHPDYKLIVTDESGAKINQGFYYPTNNAQKTKEENERRAKMEISRVLHIARAVVGPNYEFEAVSTPKEVFDYLFKVIADNAGDAKFNVFVTYGQITYPSKFLGLRYFDFIEPVGTVKSTLRTGNKDLMERINPDEPQAGGEAGNAAPSTDWFK